MKKVYWLLLLFLLVVILIISVLSSDSCTDGCGTSIITLDCQVDNDCKYIEIPPVPGEAGCYKLKESAPNLAVNNDIQCECISNICKVKT